MKLTSTKDKSLTNISALLHGDSGIGKTTSCLTLPEDRTIIATGERGTLPLRNKAYPVLRFDSWDDIQAIYMLFANPKEIKDDAIKKAVSAATVLFVDSLSECSNLCVKHIVTVERKRLTRERTGDKRDSPPGVYEDQMGMEDWGLYRTRMLKMIGSYTHLPINIIFTCLSAWSKDKQGGDVYRTPNLSGKTAMECSAHFDLVLHMESDKDGNRQWRTFNDGEVVAKDASGVLDPFEPTDWTQLFSKILKGTTNAKTG